LYLAQIQAMMLESEALSPLSFDNGCNNAWIATRIVALTPSMKQFLRLKFGELRSRDVAIATNFVARNGEKSA